MPSRRAFLAAAALPLATGCLGRRGGSSPSNSTGTTRTTRATATTTNRSTTPADPIQVPTRLPWSETATVDGTSVAPSDAWHQHSVVHLTSPDTMSVEAFGDRQVLFVQVSVAVSAADGPVPAPSDFRLDAGDVSVDGRTSVDDFPAQRTLPDGRHDGGVHSTDEPGGWIVFPLPDGITADEATLSVQFGGENEGQVRWPLPADVLASLRDEPPAFSLESLDVPGIVPPDEPFEVVFAVSNDGGPGVFRAAVNELGPMYAPHPVRLAVDAGGAASASVDIDTHVRSGSDEVRIEVVTTRRSVTRTVRVQ